MLEATVYRWNGHAFDEFAPVVAEYATVRAAEAWQVIDGHTVGWIQHMQRFSGQLTAIWPKPINLWEFYSAVVDNIPSTGRWYPLLECSVFEHNRLELILRLRTSPSQQDQVRLVTATGDERISPHTKGPDLAYQMQLRRSAQMAGADESAFLSATGEVLGGALSNLVWWRGEKLYAVPDSPRKFPGITESLVISVAEATGIPVGTAWVTPAQLAGLEVWALSSTYGIRVVTAWDHNGTQLQFLNTAKHRMWTRRLRSFESRLDN